MDWKKFLLDWLETTADESLKERLMNSKASALNNWAYYSCADAKGSIEILDRVRSMCGEMIECPAVASKTFAELLGKV